MIGRLDDYLRDVALDNRADVTESDIQASGLAVSKRAYEIYLARGGALGDPMADWLQAERELRQLRVARAAPKKRQRATR